MKRFLMLGLVAGTLVASERQQAWADYGYGGIIKTPGIHPYYDHWRPWWGGIGGWGPKHGVSSYPAYCGAPTSGYRYRPCRFPPVSNTYSYTMPGAGYAQYPRTFVYDWSTKDGDQAPQPRTDAPPPEPYQAP